MRVFLQNRGGGIFNALTKSNKISTLVSKKHFNPRSKSEVFHGQCRAQTKAPPVLFYPPYYLSNSRSARIPRGRRFVDNIRARLDLAGGSRTDRFNVSI